MKIGIRVVQFIESRSAADATSFRWECAGPYPLGRDVASAITGSAVDQQRDVSGEDKKTGPVDY
jgi:hypothetical protein